MCVFVCTHMYVATCYRWLISYDLGCAHILFQKGHVGIAGKCLCLLKGAHRHKRMPELQPF